MGVSYTFRSFSFYKLFKAQQLMCTITVLKDIKIAPTSGLRTIPNGNRIPAACGKQRYYSPLPTRGSASLFDKLLFPMLAHHCHHHPSSSFVNPLTFGSAQFYLTFDEGELRRRFHRNLSSTRVQTTILPSTDH